MRSNGFAPAFPGDLAAQRGAWLLVAALHLLAGWTLTRPDAEAAPGDGPPLTLVYINLPPPLPAQPPAPAVASPATRPRDGGYRPRPAGAPPQAGCGHPYPVRPDPDPAGADPGCDRDQR